MREETFGPVAAVRVVDSFDEALEAADGGELRPRRRRCSRRRRRNAQRAWRELEVGTVKVNAVFGGAPGGAAQPRGASGTGFGYGPELLDELTTTKVVHVEPAPQAQVTRSRRGFGRCSRPTLATGRPSTRTTSAVKSLCAAQQRGAHAVGVDRRAGRLEALDLRGVEAARDDDPDGAVAGLVERRADAPGEQRRDAAVRLGVRLGPPAPGRRAARWCPGARPTAGRRAPRRPPARCRPSRCRSRRAP